MNTYKCVLVGDGGVGKTTLVKGLLTQQFERKYVATLGVEVHPLIFGNTRFNVWDTAGQEKFGGLRDGYYIQANCGLVCFDLTSPVTFKNAVRWAHDLGKYTQNLVLVGFKSDLDPRVSQDQILQLCELLQCPYFEISTKVGTGIRAPFLHLKERFEPRYASL